MGCVVTSAFCWKVLCLVSVSICVHAAVEEELKWPGGTSFWNMTLLTEKKHNPSPTPADYLMHLTTRKHNGQNGNTKGRLKSPILLSSAGCKVAVEHELLERTTLLTVKQVEAGRGLPVRQLVLRGSNVSGDQEERELRLFYTKATFVLIEGVVEEKGMLLLRSVKFHSSCHFQHAASRSICDDDEYNCLFSLLCIKHEKVCDFVMDCPEGDDESECGITDFEKTMGGWYESANYDPPYGWRWVAAQEAPYSGGTAPDHDHTVGTTGHFMWAPGVSAAESPSTAVAEAPVVGPIVASCTVSFWYQRKGGTPGLRFVLHTEDSYFKIDDNLPETNSLEWNEWRIQIGAYEKVSLEFISNWHKIDFEYSDVCIDDVDMLFCSRETPPFEDEIRCNFNDEYDICRLYQSHDDDANWGTSYDSRHPADRYMKTISSGGNQTMQTWWYSKGDTFCVSFSYMLDESTDLRVVLVKENMEEELWRREGPLVAWQVQHLQLTIDTIFQVHFRSTTADEKYAYLDNVFLLDGRCPLSLTCTFDGSDDCPLEDFTDGTAALTWMVGSGNTTSNDAPPYDHTWMTSMGQYLFLPLQPEEEGQKAYVKSHNISSTTTPEGDCLHFWYYLFSKSQSSSVGEMGIRLLLKDNTVTDRIWERSYDQHQEWQFGAVTIKDEDFCILFEGLRKTGTEGGLAWDDISIGRGKCDSVGDCTFENGLCGYEDQHYNDYSLNEWEWGKARYVLSGPGDDHTLLSGQGHYVITFPETCPTGRCSAHLDSMEVIAEEDTYCLSFYTNIRHIGDDNYLAIDVVNVDENMSQNRFMIKDSYEQSWTWYSHSISDLPQLFQVRFRAETLPPMIIETAYIAVDDIHLTPGPCQDLSTQYPISTPTPDTMLTCNFEGNSLCGWSQDTEDDGQWHLTTGETIDSGLSFESDKLGPFIDHTTGLSSGHFLYINNKRSANDTIILISEPLPQDTPHCFSFNYYIHGSHTPALKLYIIEDVSKGVPDWSAVGEHGEVWQLMRIFISNKTKVMPRIVLEAYQEVSITDDTSHLALDDFVLIDGSCSNAGFGMNCDFEAADLCEYVVINEEGDGGWTRGIADNNLPATDHTYNSITGHYLFLDFTPGNMTTSLIVTPFLPTSEKMCVKWYYYIDGPDNMTASLRVYLRSSSAKHFSGDDEADFWEVNKPEGPSWHLGQMDVQSFGNMYVEFQGRIKSFSETEIIAIDDVSSVAKACPAPATCSFESGMCGWYDAGLNVDLQWLMNSGPTPTPNTGPSVDHTLGTLYGHYMYISASSGYEGARAQLVSELLPSGEYCFEFYYYMSGMTMGGLAVYMNVIEGENYQVFNRSGNQGEKWRLAQISIVGIHDFSLGIEGIVGSWVESDIAVDDAWTYVGLCEELPNQFLCRDGTPLSEDKVCDFIMDCSAGEDESECGTCNFETDLCGWKTLNSSTYVWTVGMNMSTSESDDGIVYDHTMGTEEGHFLYVTEEPSNEGGGPAVLASPFYHNTQVQCTMVFWYRENSNEVLGRHTIVTVSVRRDEDITPVAYTVNKQNDDWKQEEVSLQDWQGSFEVLMEASTTASYSDLTVDDVSFMNCGLLHEEADCLDTQFKCHETGVCVDAAVICDNTNDCGDKSDEFDCKLYDPVCTFEDEQPCYWTQEPEQDDIDWRLGSGPTPTGKYSLMTGPPVDHTTRLSTGRYMYITQEPLKEMKMKRAWFVSPVLQALGDENCILRFHYYMYGKNVHSLNVYQTLTKHGNKQLIFSKNGELGQFWNRAIVYSSTQQLFQIIIEGITNSDDYSDIAIDDLSFFGCIILNETLPTGTTTLPPSDPCNDNEFYCNVENECVPLPLRCNWQADCSNGADEDECGDCDFEYGMCSWYDDSVGIFQWKRLRAGDISVYDHPNVDHTFANNTGHILYVEGSDGIAGKTAVLKSPTILQKGGSYCQLHFWLYQKMAMNVKLVIFVDSDVLHLQIDDFMTTGPREGTWYNVILPIPNMTINHHFTLEATPVFDEGSAWADSQSVLAIDDIEYFDCSSNNVGLDCCFDDISDHQGFCMWRASADCQQYWKHSARFPGDISDHTTGQSFYIYVDFSDQLAMQGNYARLESAVQLNSSSKSHILSLWYFMHGENVGTFRILQRLKHEQINNTYLDISGPQDYRWNLFSTVLDTTTYFSIILEAEWDEVGPGILAVDDIVMQSDTDLQICDFQIDFCQWTSQPGNTSWERTRGKDHPVGCPPLDHSDNSDMGYYAYLVPTGRESDRGYLYSPTFENVGSQCLRIWYYLDVGDADSIEIMARDEKTAEIAHITTLNCSTSNMWALGLATISGIEKFSVIIEGITGLTFGNAAIDDLEFIQGTCPDAYECDFEYDTCSWSNVKTQDTFDWQRSSGGEGSGIMVDHTINYETGHYMAARVADKKLGDSAELVGGIVPASRSCITLWYSMQNKNGLTLTVMLSEDSNDVPIAVFYNSSQDQLWDQATIKLVITSDVFRVSLQVDVLQDQGSSESDSVGIDDIAFTTDCNVATPPPYQTTPPATHMPTIFDCDFEQESARFCAWDQDLSLGIYWMVGKGDTPTDGTGPPTDHTFLTEEGHYIFVGTVAQQNRSARLSSPIISTGEKGACLSFWYHMHGPNIGRLQVLLSTPDNIKVASIWQRTHEQGKTWMQAKISIGYESSGSQLIIEATPHSQGKGDIAVDDIMLDFKECSNSLLCDFEGGMCNFEQSVNDNLDWKLVSKLSSDSNSEFMPLADHSQQAAVGHYLELDGEGSSILFTGKYHPDHKCVQFWFFSNGPTDSDHSALNVYLYSNDHESPLLLLTVKDTFSCEWMLYKLPLDTVFYYSVAFQGDLHNGSVFGLDDVQPLMTCEPWTECTFETDLCIWKNSDEDDDMDWSLITASHLTSSYGPNVDVTLGSPYAGFVYFEPPDNGGTAILETYNLGPGIWCLDFWVHLQSLGRIALSIALQDLTSEITQILYENHEVIHADWKFEQVLINVTRTFKKIFFLANSSVSSAGIIALDQISVYRDHCSNTTVPECDVVCDVGICVTQQQMCNFIQDCTQGQDEKFCGYNCTFEQADDDYCTWNSVSETTKGELSWILLQGQNSNDTLGPSVDHTLLTNQGHYTALVPRNHAGADASGELFRSPVLYNSAAECRLTFWYVLYELPSTDPGFLRVSYNTSDAITLLLGIIPTERNEWIYGLAYIGRIRTRFSLFFEGNRNLQSDGFTAIDDIKFEQCFLPSVNQTSCQQFTCANSACVSIFDKCDFVDNCGDDSDEDDNLAQCSMYIGRCNFEDGSFCSWESQDGEWQLGSPSSKSIIPSRDHTLNSALGSYIYIESTDMKNASKQAKLTSHVFYSSSVLCHLRFYYFMDGPAVDKLSISAKDSLNGPLEALEIIPGPIGQLWERAEVIPTVQKLQQVVITGSLSKDTTGITSVIAVDDISFTSECTSSESTLPTITSPVSTTTNDYCENEYTCLNEKCIPFANVCDFKDDCGDNTDEKLCAECDFESNQCGWEDRSFGVNRWQRVNGTPYARKQFVMKVTGDGSGVEEEANLVSVHMGASSASCTMSFYYYLQSTDTVLELRIQTGNTQLLIWSAFEDLGNTWNQVTVGIMKRDSNWTLQYHINKLATEGMIMIDDIHFQNCALTIPQNCREDQFSCDNGNCINSTQICDFSNDCGDNTDELAFTCQTYADRCNFETDFCNWEQDHHDDLDFIRKNGETLSEGVGPDYDHTYGNESGYYLYLQSVEGIEGKNAKIASPSFIPSDGSCHFRFWYIIKKGKNASLSVCVHESSPNTFMEQENMTPSSFIDNFLWTKEDNCIFQSRGTANYLWTFVDLAITYTRFFKIIMEAWTGKILTGDVSIDDISFSSECHRSECMSNEFQCYDKTRCIQYAKKCDFQFDCNDKSDEEDCYMTCSFEDNQCGWKEGDNDGYNWIRAKAGDTASGTDQTGPFTDQSGSEDGYFLLLHENSSNLVGQVGETFSHWYQNSKSECLFVFWYYMSKNLGSYVILRLNSSQEDFIHLTLFDEESVIGDAWTFSSTGIGRRTDPFQLSLYSAKTEGVSGVFAVDETSFQYCTLRDADCTTVAFHCTTTERCIYKSALCDLVDDCGDGEDETEEICSHFLRTTLENECDLGWFTQGQDGEDDDTQWLCGTGDSTSIDKSPNYDHTQWSRAGQYLYMDVPLMESQTARLISQFIQAGPECSFTFYFNLFRDNFGMLTILFRKMNGSTSVFSEITPPYNPLLYNVWRKYSISRESMPHDQYFQIILEGKSQAEHVGTIALDDFVFHLDCSISNSTVSPPPITSNCTGEEFQCSDGSCVSLSKKCNFVSDCPYSDSSDEEGCVSTNCTFEGEDLCGWAIEATDIPERENTFQVLRYSNETNMIGERIIKFTWQVSKGSSQVDTLLQTYKPGQDHTTGTSSGCYVYAYSEAGNFEGSTDLATKLYFGETSKTCRLAFWYWWSGPEDGSLHVLVRPSQGSAYEVWMTDGNQGNAWQLAEVGVGDLNQSALSIQATRGIMYEGGGAVDDVTFLDCLPPTLPPDGYSCQEMDMYKCSDGNCLKATAVCDYSYDCFDDSDEASEVCRIYMYRCNFEAGFTRDWEQDVDDDTQWVLRQGASWHGLDMFPEFDHTYGSSVGHYVVMDVEMISDPHVVSRMHSPVIFGSVSACELRFWYMATGIQHGLLRIYRRTSYYSDGSVLLAMISDIARNIWLKYTIAVDSGDLAAKDYQVVIEGVSPAGRDGFIVLDDLSMTPSCERSSNQELPGGNQVTTPLPTCFPGQLMCLNGNCYNPIEACNFLDDCGDNTDEHSCTKSCDFETEDMCGWFENTASSAHWERFSFPAEPPGPFSDHYNGKASHALKTVSEESAGRIAILESAKFSTVAAGCTISFYHFQNGTGTEGVTLSLYIKAEDVDNDGHSTLMWLENSYSAEWKHESIKIGDERNFILYFEVVHSDGMSFVALDDIDFMSCIPNGECHSVLDYQCADGSCILYQYACDAKYDCHDKSDEYMCTNLQGDCDFDQANWSEECGWIQSEEDDKDWQRANTSPDNTLGPSEDHTLGSKGYYLYMDNQQEPPGRIASIKTGVLYAASEGICYVRFWYYIHNDNATADTGALRLLKEVNDGQRYLLFTRSGNYMKKWLEQVVPVSSNSSYFLLFEAETGGPFQTYIALDDFSVTPACVSGTVPPPSNTSCEIGELPCVNGECIPEGFFCDCFNDCMDGSDEYNCHTVTCSTIGTRTTTNTTSTSTPLSTTIPIPSPCNDTEIFCDDQESTCLPALLMCDGIADCSNGADEENCPDKLCDAGYMYCGDVYMQDRPCMSVDHLCDGKPFCQTHNADESMCGICPSYYCLNNGLCAVSGNKLPQCSCKQDYEGVRCETYTGLPGENTGLTGGQIAGIVIGVLLVAALAGSMVFVYITRGRRSSPHSQPSEARAISRDDIDPVFAGTEAEETYVLENINGAHESDT